MLKNSKLSKYHVRKIILCFCADITASQAAVLLGRNRNTINRWYRIFRESIYQHQEALKDALVGKVEVDDHTLVQSVFADFMASSSVVVVPINNLFLVCLSVMEGFALKSSLIARKLRYKLLLKEKSHWKCHLQ